LAIEKFLASLPYTLPTGKVGFADLLEHPLEATNEGVSKSNAAAALAYNR
jgi:hypothetical protein